MLLISETFISKYEAYLTNTPLDNWNQTLPLISITCQIIISIFMLATAVNIKVIFKCKGSQQGNPKIKNTISFKMLNLIYSIGFIIFTIIHVTLLQIKSKDTYIVQYDITMAFTLILTTFLVSNEAAMQFILSKYRSWREEQKLELRFLNCLKRTNKVEDIGTNSKAPRAIVLQPLNGSLLMA